ncbi:hypothetical protein RCO48_22050 [Peribacillus frigoritolerans]|nr:hypothetical protein [Peribacillus frigoritolerans]
MPEKLVQVLGEDIYKREDKIKVNEALNSLEVYVSDTFREFYHYYTGPFWEECVPFELLDIVDEENNIESYTFIFPKRAWLSEKSI